MEDERQYEEAPPIGNLLTQDEEPESPLEALAAKHRELSDTKEVNIPVPGYDREAPFLFIRYRLLDGKELDHIGQKVRRETRSQWQRQMYAAVDTFIAANVGLYYNMGEKDEYQELTYHGEHLTSFDESLAEALRFSDELPEKVTARSVVFALFNNNDAMIAQHNFLLNRWFTDTSLDVQAELLGNL